MKQPFLTFLEHIENLQSVGEPDFPAGIFPAYRANPIIRYSRPDTTIFFSAIICFTLGSLKKYVTSEERERIDGISARVGTNYPDFQNKDGLGTYNFWQTKPSRHFPNGHIFRHFEHFRIPDDIDDTAFVYLTSAPTSDDVRWLQHKLSQHANGSRQWIRNTYPEYKMLRAYSTWFGKHMYIEFDACVLSNMLYCLLHYQLPADVHAADSLAYIRSVVETDRYRTDPFRCAHQYPRTPLIMYHIARLISAFNPVQLIGIRAKLILDTKTLLEKTTSPMDRVILSTSLLRLGEKTQRIAVENFTARDFEGFYFFIAGLLTAYENTLFYKLASSELFHMRWLCEAHCWTLLAEYEALWNAFEAGSDGQVYH